MKKLWKKHWSQILLFTCIFALFSIADVSLAAGLDVTPNKDGLTQSINTAATNFADVVRGVFGVVTAAFLIWGGVLMMGAHGNSQKISEAKSKFMYAIGAIILVFMADKIVAVILGVIGWNG